MGGNGVRAGRRHPKTGACGEVAEWKFGWASPQVQAAESKSRMPSSRRKPTVYRATVRIDFVPTITLFAKEKKP
jgi:hypothetical protein